MLYPTSGLFTPPPLTPELLICQALLVGQQVGEQPIQVSDGAPGNNVEKDGPVEDFEDGRRLRGRGFGALWLLPIGREAEKRMGSLVDPWVRSETQRNTFGGSYYGA